MSPRRITHHGKVFTVAEANATLPLVRAITGDLAGLSQEVSERRRRLAFLLEGHDPESSDPYREELVQIQQELDKDSRRLQDYVRELRSLGVEPTSGPDGLVDFPTVIQGRKAYLCWKLGEPEVLYWHEADAGFAQRRRLPAEALAEKGLSGAEREAAGR